MRTKRLIARAAVVVALVGSTLGARIPPAEAQPVPFELIPSDLTTPEGITALPDPSPSGMVEKPELELVIAAELERQQLDYEAAQLAEWLRVEAENAERARLEAARNTARPASTRSGYPALTPAGLEAMIFCESGSHGRHSASTGNSFHGAVQWLPATWRAAAHRAGFGEWAETPVEWVPPWVQDAVTYSWWSSSNPSTQWPVCHRAALRAMGY